MGIPRCIAAPGSDPRRRAILASSIAALLLVLLLALPGSARAHAELLGTEPGNEATLDVAPDELTLSFSEDVTAPFGAIKVYGPDAQRVEAGSATVDGDTVSVPVGGGESGTYAVSWRVLSGDGHPVRGAFVYHVDEASADDASRDAALAASEESKPTEVAFGIARGGILLGVLAAVGGVLFAVIAAGSWQSRWVRTSLVLAIASMLVAYVLDASIAAGLSFVDALDPEVLREQSETIYGRATLVRLALALACLLLTLILVSPRWQRPAVRWLVAVPFVALAASLSLSGHAVGEDVTGLRLPVDMLHAIAAAAWLGGLVQLIPWSRATPVSGQVLDRWSRVALASVAVLVVTGSWAAWEEIGFSLEGLLDTTYGRLVLCKFILLVATLPLANLNRVRHVPAVKRGDPDATHRLRTYVRVEIGILVLVLAATAWLIQTPPAKVQLQPDFVEQTKSMADGTSLQLVVDPAAVGRNEMHVYAFDEQLQVDDEVTEVTLVGFNDERDLGPLEFETQPTGPGHFTIVEGTIPFAGEWRFEAGVKRGKFDEQRATFDVDVAPAGG